MLTYTPWPLLFHTYKCQSTNHTVTHHIRMHKVFFSSPHSPTPFSISCTVTIPPTHMYCHTHHSFSPLLPGSQSPQDSHASIHPSEVCKGTYTHLHPYCCHSYTHVNTFTSSMWSPPKLMQTLPPPPCGYPFHHRQQKTGTNRAQPPQTQVSG